MTRRITTTFVRKAGRAAAGTDYTGVFDGTDSLGTAPQEFTASELLAWLRWHLQENRAVRITVESERAERGGAR